MTTTKKPYQRPAMTVVEIATEQVICTSPTQQYGRYKDDGRDIDDYIGEFD